MLRRLIVAILLFIGLVLVCLLLIRFAITRSITCTPKCVGVNLMDRNLQGIDLHDAKLMEAQLQNADLSATNLRAADLSGANLVRVNLRNADLTDARLIGSDLSGARLEGAILNGADLSGANLSEADLTNVDLRVTLLGGANFAKAKLTNVQLQGASLAGLNFSEAGMAGANLERTSLAGAALSLADLSGASLVQADLTGAWLNLANLVGANLTNADLAGSSLIGAELSSTNLQGSNLSGAILVGAQLYGANLRSANLQDARTLPEQLPQHALQLDPLLQALNLLQQETILQETQMNGAASDTQTIWPAGATASVNSEKESLALQLPTSVTATTGTTISAVTDSVREVPAAKRVAVNFFVNSLRNINSQTGKFTGDFYMDLYWQDANIPATQEISELAPEQVWQPKLMLVNSQNGKFLFGFHERSSEPGVNLRFSSRAVGDFTSEFDLRRFPFDQQNLMIKLESSAGNSDQVLLEFVDLNQSVIPSEQPYVQAIPKGRYLDSQAVDNEWRVNEARIAQQLYIYVSDQSSYSRFQIEFTLARRSAPYVWKYMVPLFLLALFAWSTCLVDATQIAVRFWLLTLLLLTLAIFHLVLWGTLPQTPYLTYLDRFLLLHYTVLAGLIAVFFGIKFLQQGRYSRVAQWLNRGLMVGYPLCYVAINFLLYWQIG